MPEEVKKSDSNLMGALCYISILSIVMLLVKKDDPFVQFHAKQGVVLFVCSFIGIVPVVGWILSLCVLVLAIMGFINALQGKQAKLPVVGDLAEKINL